MESYVLSAAFPAELRQVTLALYTNLQDPAALRQRLIMASTMEGQAGVEERKRLDYAFLDSSMIASRDHVLTAAQQAILTASQGEPRTQTIHSELIDHLNPTSNIGEGLRRFGVSSTSSSVLLVKIGAPLDAAGNKALEEEMQSVTAGELQSLDTLVSTVDTAALAKMYKISKQKMSIDLLVTLTAMNKTVGVF